MYLGCSQRLKLILRLVNLPVLKYHTGCRPLRYGNTESSQNHPGGYEEDVLSSVLLLRAEYFRRGLTCVSEPGQNGRALS